MKNLILVFAILVVGFEAFGGNCSVEDASRYCKCEKQAQERLCPRINALFNKYGHIDYVVKITSSSGEPNVFSAVVMADMFAVTETDYRIYFNRKRDFGIDGWVGTPPKKVRLAESDPAPTNQQPQRRRARRSGTF